MNTIRRWTAVSGQSNFTTMLFALCSLLYSFTIPTQFGKHFWLEYTYIHGVRIDYLAPYISIFDIVCILIVTINLIPSALCVMRRHMKLSGPPLEGGVPLILKHDGRMGGTGDVILAQSQTSSPPHQIAGEGYLLQKGGFQIAIQSPVFWLLMTVAIAIFILTNTFSSLSPLVTLFRFAKIVLYFLAGYLVIESTFDLNRDDNVTPDDTLRVRSQMATNREAKLDSSRSAYAPVGGWRTRTIISFFVYGIFASTLLVFILAVWQFVTKSSVGGLWYFLGERDITLSLPGIAKIAYDGREFLRPYSTFSHPNSMGGFYLVLYFLADWINKQIKVKKHKIINFSTQILSLLIVILSFSKVAIGVFVLLSFIKLVRDKDYRSCILCLSARISIFIFLLFFVFLFSGDPYTLDKRLFLTTQSFQVIKDHWPTGTGLGASLVAQSKLSGSIPGRFTDTLQPVHNIYLLFVSEVGVVGVVLLSLLIYQKRKLFALWQKLPLAAISAILLTGLFDHYSLTLPQNMALLCLMIALSIFAFVIPSNDGIQS